MIDRLNIKLEAPFSSPSASADDCLDMLLRDGTDPVPREHDGKGKLSSSPSAENDSGEEMVPAAFHGKARASGLSSPMQVLAVCMDAHASFGCDSTFTSLSDSSAAASGSMTTGLTERRQRQNTSNTRSNA
jgi:hypothetical protein